MRNTSCCLSHCIENYSKFITFKHLKLLKLKTAPKLLGHPVHMKTKDGHAERTMDTSLSNHALARKSTPQT